MLPRPPASDCRLAERPVAGQGHRGTAVWNGVRGFSDHLVRGRRPAFRLTLAGAGLLGAAWSPESVPPDWRRVRDQWEYAHAARFVMQLAGFGALILSVLSEAPPEGRLERLREASAGPSCAVARAFAGSAPRQRPVPLPLTPSANRRARADDPVADGTRGVPDQDHALTRPSCRPRSPAPTGVMSASRTPAPVAAMRARRSQPSVPNERRGRQAPARRDCSDQWP